MKSPRFAIACLGAAAILSSLASCDSGVKLARDIAGTWATTPEKLIDSDAMSAAAVRMFQFTPSTTDNRSGDLQMTALVSITNALPGDSTTIIEPYTVTASGIANITGIWAAVDGDKVSLHFDESTLNVKVDTSAVMVSVNSITGATASSIDSLKPAMAASLKEQITEAVRDQVFDINALDDIKITSGLMSCEINKRDVTFRRQDEAVK